MNRLSDNHEVDLWPTVDVLGGVIGAVWYDMGDKDEGAFIFEVENATPGTLDISVKCAEDDAGTNPEIPANFQFGVQAFAPGSHKVAVEFSSEDLVEGKPFVSLDLAPGGFEPGDSLTIAFVGYEVRKHYANRMGCTLRLKAPTVTQPVG